MRAGNETVPVLLFGGTTEGHRLAEYLAGRKQPVILCVATEYGREVLGGALSDCPWMDIRVGRQDEKQMKKLLRQERPGLVIDATHPYADLATRNLRSACRQMQTEYIRCLRPGADIASRTCSGEADQELHFPDSKAAAGYLSGTEGGILVTTGSKELAVYAAIPGFSDRVYARVLPTVESVQLCLGLGLKGRHIIAMQGPFSRETNISQLREFGCGYLVTKDTGKAGGYREKILAAKEARAVALVIDRPEEMPGLTVEQVIFRYEQWREADGR